jgi:hypothetical protein
MLTLLSDGLSPISEDGYPHSLVEVGAMIALCHQNDEHGSYGVILDFVEWFDELASVVDRAHAVAGRPELLDAGHAKWNVYLASLGEHMAISNGFVVPEWTAELPRRRLSELWCPMDIPTDIRDCPPTFWSRNILAQYSRPCPRRQGSTVSGYRTLSWLRLSRVVMSSWKRP